MSSKILKIKNTFLFFLPIFFIFSINSVKADTFTNQSTAPDSLSYVVTFNTNKLNYAPNEQIIAQINGGGISYIDSSSNFHAAGIFSSINYSLGNMDIKNKTTMSLINTLQYNSSNFQGQMIDVPPIFCVMICTPISVLQTTISPNIINPGTYLLQTEIKDIYFTQVGLTLDCTNGCGGLIFGSGNSGVVLFNGLPVYYVSKTIPIETTINIGSDAPQIFVK